MTRLQSNQWTRRVSQARNLGADAHLVAATRTVQGKPVEKERVNSEECSILMLEPKRQCGTMRSALLGDHRGLTRNIEALAAAHVLAGHHVVLAHHIGAELGEARAVTLVGASGKLTLFRAHHPGDLIVRRLMAMRTIQRCRLLFLLLVKKLALFHRLKNLSTTKIIAYRRGRTTHKPSWTLTELNSVNSNNNWHGQKKEKEELSSSDCG